MRLKSSRSPPHGKDGDRSGVAWACGHGMGYTGGRAWECEHGCEHSIGWAWQQTAANSIPQEEMGWGDGLSGGSEKS